MGATIAPKRMGNEGEMQPKYLRYNLWGADQGLPITIAEWSESAAPLPRPPQAELENPLVKSTLATYPHLFSVDTPINVDRLETFLADHPNRPFVDSVLVGLREGFWPWASTQKPGYPSTFLQEPTGIYTDAHHDFFRKQLKHEQTKGRYSASVGQVLIPGMYCMPIYAVPKPDSSDLRLVNDYSAGPFSLNSMVDHDSVVGYPLDNLHQLGQMLLDLQETAEGLDLVMWKSDISEAYRLCPLHKAWQLKQGVRIDGELYIDRACCFGCSASFAIFASVNSLVTWVAKNRRSVNPLITYVDDSSGAAIEGDVEFYTPHDAFIPTPQFSLLSLWDEIGVPHKPKKQLHGSTLTIIGIEVDPNLLRYTLPEASRERLKAELRKWSAKRTTRFPLRRWQAMCGWINWSLNVFPLLRPCLNEVYHKLSGKTHRNENIRLNNSVRADFEWGLRLLDRLPPVYILESLAWNAEDADTILFCDACPTGLGFWIPSTAAGFFAESPFEIPPFIFYLEALCVLNALLHTSLNNGHQRRVLIYTDNQNSVDIFSSLRCLPQYNGIIKSSVDIRVDSHLDLRVLHVPGESNQVADALSRGEFTRAMDLCPELTISPFVPCCPDSAVEAETFEPPLELLGGGQT